MVKPLFLVNNLFPAYFAGTNFSVDEIPEKFAYIIDADGWKILKRNGVSTALIPVSAVTGLPRLGSEIKFTASKISLNLVRKVTGWFREIYKKFKSEASGYLYYHPELGWDFIPPTQTTGPAHVNYESAPKKENGWNVAGTIHSHAAMSAFHSGTDQNDESFFDGIHITIGKLDSVPEYSCSIVVQGVREVVDPSYLIDGISASDVPLAWMNAVKSPKPAMAQPFQSRVDELYSKYFSSKISEAQYQVELKKLEKEEEVWQKSQIQTTSFNKNDFDLSSPYSSGFGKDKKKKSYRKEDYEYK